MLIEKYRDLLENTDFEQNYYSRISTRIYKIGYDSIQFLKKLDYYDRFFSEN